MFALVLSLVFCLVPLYCSGQYADDQNQPPKTMLTRDNVEAILDILARRNPLCQSELEAALGSQSEISDPCKMEIQTVLLELDIPITQTIADDFETTNTGKVTQPDDMNPLYMIGAFITVLLAAIVSYIMYVNNSRGEYPTKSPKKMSKKKEEKLRQKGGARR